MPELLLPGTQVEARGLRWEVVLSQQLGPQMLFRLRGLDRAVRGQEFDLLSPFEKVEPIQSELCPEKATTLRNWLVYHQAFLLEQALGPDTLLAVQPGRLRLEPYQLVPVMRALTMSRVRLLLADGVGLGKTIEAGLVITELMARRLAHRLLVVSPAGVLLEQWRTELLERFGLRMEVIDKGKLEDVRREQELGANPFDQIPLGLTSIDFLKQDRILDLLHRSNYDIIVIDEAHHCFDLGSKVREDSLRRRLAAVLARSCDALLLLTATPHDGNDRSFASLVELLDLSLVDGKGRLCRQRYKEHVVRRLKSHLGDKFKTREVRSVPVELAEEKCPNCVRLHRALLRFIAPQLKRAFRARRYSDVLAFIALLKRSVSTVNACYETLQAVMSRFEKLISQEAESQESRRQRRITLKEYRRRTERFGVLSHEEEKEQSEIEAEDIAHELAKLDKDVRSGAYKIRKWANVMDALTELCDLAGAARAEDPKLWEIADQIRTIRRDTSDANILVYTEYIDSQDVIAEHLEQCELGSVLRLSGEHDEATRKKTTERFRTHLKQILVSTDASAEGLNLHQRCHHLIHVELPWNPNRLEQRNGRIDRYGQTEDPVVRYLFLSGTFEQLILLRLVLKYEKQRSTLTFVPNTLGITTSTDDSAARIIKCFIDADTTLFRPDAPDLDFEVEDSLDAADPAVKELLEEIERSLRGYKEATLSNAWLGSEGVHAGKERQKEAEEAIEGGEKQGVDLERFVLDAIRLDGGSVQKDDRFCVAKLPPAWCHNLDDIPGYDVDARCIRLTTVIDLTHDSNDNTVGFLGRAHPLVRRALDRVRNLSFGGDTGQDRRVSAVRAAVNEPQLLLTYIGRVSSKKGREFERVLAVRMNQTACTAKHLSANDWASLVDPSNAISTRDVWKDYFASWGKQAIHKARPIAEDLFKPVAEGFIRNRVERLNAEKWEQKQWLQKRSKEITGSVAARTLVTKELFEDATETDSASSWQYLTDPLRRLAAFGADSKTPPGLGTEVETVLRIYRKRKKGLQARLDISEAEIIPLGLLMIVPEKEL